MESLHQLAHLPVAEGQKARPARSVLHLIVRPHVHGTGEKRVIAARRMERRKIGMRPVGVRKVQPDVQAGIAHGLAVGRDHVASGGAFLHDAVVAQRRVPHGHAVVVLRSQHGIARARLLKQRRPRRRIVARGGKAVVLRKIVLPAQRRPRHVLSVIVHGPGLRHAFDRIDAPVQEYAQLGPMEPAFLRNTSHLYFPPVRLVFVRCIS